MIALVSSMVGYIIEPDKTYGNHHGFNTVLKLIEKKKNSENLFSPKKEFLLVPRFSSF